MGVYIKGMEMPKNCGDCKAFVCYRQWAGDVGDCFCGITKNNAEAKKKNADCPLVPVPPHGRLIDADALIKVLKARTANPLNQETRPYSWSFAYECLADVAGDMPTILEAEEGE